ncbi:hypothetical protein NVP2275O_451 [Vibrio phage 2.275.O._10N.286.54.E11]|nr:hypothetical protein NVP2275O_451 [Vibrio phage 2.275.O._10N.286.54.E11]
MVDQADKVNEIYNALYVQENPFKTYPLMENIELYSELKKLINSDIISALHLESRIKSSFNTYMSMVDYCEANHMLAAAQHDVDLSNILLERLSSYTQNFNEEDKVTYELL